MFLPFFTITSFLRVQEYCVPNYEQCGGIGYFGSTNCCLNARCEYVNDYWWQCNDIKHLTVPDCFKVRRNILSLNQTEVDDLIQAFFILKLRGVYDNITWYHGEIPTFYMFHGNNFFLPWHRWYVLYIENAIRDIGGRFSCFAMPYWDWALDATKENSSSIWNIFGPLGSPENDFCMSNGPFVNWTTTVGNHTCLKRLGSDTVQFDDIYQMSDLIKNNADYNASFRDTFESGSHAYVHLFVGGSVNTKPAPDDPLFWLHHTFVDMVFAMWQDFHNYTSSENITEEQFLSSEVDIPMVYANMTTRQLWSILENNYTYQVDDFSSTLFDWTTLISF
jgi:tyrosinase